MISVFRLQTVRLIAALIVGSLVVVGPLSTVPFLAGGGEVPLTGKFEGIYRYFVGSKILLERAHLGGVDLVRFSLIMAVASVIVLFAVALPYWALLGEGLTG